MARRNSGCWCAWKSPRARNRLSKRWDQRLRNEGGYKLDTIVVCEQDAHDHN
jgi:hypothetical protein